MTTRIVLAAACLVAMATLVAPQCGQFPNPTNPQSPHIRQSLELWESVGLIAGIGVFALLVAIVFVFCRRVVYHDTHLLDTFYDAGGKHNFIVISLGVVSRWLWLVLSPTIYMFGIAGQFWVAAGTSVQLLLFSTAASEFRIKAPGAKTFLQVIRCRFGNLPHIIIMPFAVIINLFIAGVILGHSSEVLTALTTGITYEVMAVLLALAASIFTIVGGVGGGLYMAYFACSGIVAIALTYFFSAFFVNNDGPTHSWGFDYGDRPIVDSVCDIVQCGRVSPKAENLHDSTLTFSSLRGFLSGVLYLLTGFCYVFLNQSFWTSATTGEPHCSVIGFLAAGISYFVIPFTLIFTFGMGHWVTSVLHGLVPLSRSQAFGSYIHVVISQLTLGRTGDFLMFTLILLIVIMTTSAQIHSLSSIFMYDIYQTYINPFRPPYMSRTASLAVYRDQEISQYLSYNRRSVFVHYASIIFFSVLTYPAALVYLSIQLPVFYKYVFVAIVVGSSVLPAWLSVAWHRTTGMGVVSGILTGLAAGIVALLLYGMSFPGGLTDFVDNTGRQEVLIVGLVTSILGGGIICVMISLCCGGLDPSRNAESEWEKCRLLDNPVKPWALQYASPGCVEREPSYQQVRYKYRSAELAAYVVGTLLTVLIVLVWPALMLLAGVFNCSAFTVWAMLAMVLAVIAALYLGLLPPLAVIIQLCRGREPLCRLIVRQKEVQVKADVPQQDNVMYVTSHALATKLDVMECPQTIPDDESSIIDNSDGLNVLSDPRKPSRASGRRAPVTTPAPKTAAPVVYPLSSMSLQPYASCGPLTQQYCVSASDIPLNGVASTNQPTSVHLD